MKADLAPLIVGGLVFLASLISLKLGLSVAIIEILVGAIAGNAGLRPESWMTYASPALAASCSRSSPGRRSTRGCWRKNPRRAS
ncbi:MAG: hypothetical protein MZV63_40295 [Marinilabiliales bacterium]|nr:hypothetical protein [Marinilabiliales bacterium]